MNFEKTKTALISELKNYTKSFYSTFRTFIKWLLCGAIIGFVVGFIGSAFHHALEYVTHFRSNNSWLLFLLPLSGIIIVFMYRYVCKSAKAGTNLVISAIQSNERVPLRMTPLIIISTIITHLFGGSAGREGAALQIGGSLGNFFAKIVKYDEKDTKIAIMCGMSACFSALFGTPVAAAIFSMEVISVGIMHYAALVPCVVSALIAYGVSCLTGLTGTRFNIPEVAAISPANGGKLLLASMFFSLASILLCTFLHSISHMYTHFIKNEYLRIIVAGLFIIILRYLCGTTDYLGAGTAVIEKSFIESCAWYVFLLKMIFTAITLGGGFKGGEIVPTLFVGATLGSFLAPLLGLPIPLCAACGMISLFCGVTNCPITSIILAIEMFGSKYMIFYILCIAVSYLLSGYFSLYNTQKITYSKYKPEYIDKQSL